MRETEVLGLGARRESVRSGRAFSMSSDEVGKGLLV